MRTRRPSWSLPFGRRETARWPRLSWRGPVRARPPIALAAVAALALVLLGFLSLRMLWHEPPTGTGPSPSALALASRGDGDRGSKEGGPDRRPEHVAIPRVKITERAAGPGPGTRAAPVRPKTSTPPLNTALPGKADGVAAAAEPSGPGVKPGLAPEVKDSPAPAVEGRPGLPATRPPAPPAAPAAKPRDLPPRPARSPASTTPSGLSSPGGLTRPASSEPLRPEVPGPVSAPPVVDRPPPAPIPPETAPPRPPTQTPEPAEPDREPVAVRVVVGPQGRARSAVVVRSSGDPRRDTHAVQQALRRRYRPPRGEMGEREVSVEVGGEVSEGVSP
jgi:TonB family protein